MKIKDLPLGVELKRHYNGSYVVRRTKDGETNGMNCDTFNEAIDFVRHLAKEDRKEKSEGDDESG